MNNKKRVLVAGGAGFIGSFICERLINLDYEVIAIDNFITGSMNNLAKLQNEKSFYLIEQDIISYINISGKIDYIINLASIASPLIYQKYPIHTAKSGSIGANNLLELAVKKNAKILMASTSEVYGDPKCSPQSEDYNGNVSTTGLRSCYDEAKRFMEAITMAYHRQKRVNVSIARIFNTYGPRMAINDGRAVPAFISQVINKEPITIFGSGNQTRSFCYIQDTLNALINLLHTDYKYPINIGNSEEITINELASKIINVFGLKNYPIEYRSMPEDDPKQRRPDTRKANTILSWTPVVSLDNGLKDTKYYFEKKMRKIKKT